MINLHDYSHTAAQRGWGAGWPSCAGANGNLAVVSADRSGTRVSVHKRLARLVDLLMDETERRGYFLKPGQTGAFNCRPIGGTRSPSNHSWGLAVDVNWQDNPFTANVAANHIPAWMPPLWNHYGFAWGGNYTGKHDFMHFEFMGTPADADMMTLWALNDFKPGNPAPPAAPAPPVAPVAQTTVAVNVTALQTFARKAFPAYAHSVVIDGVIGAQTLAWLKEFQKRSGLVPDGVIGPLTLAALRRSGFKG